ncbi:hypothetical protein ACQ4PT_071447 [Festuca glaucescens]
MVPSLSTRDATTWTTWATLEARPDPSFNGVPPLIYDWTWTDILNDDGYKRDSEIITMDPEPFRATAGQLRALPNWRKRPIIRGPGIEGEYEFEAFIEFANRVKMSYGDFDALERLVMKHVSRIPMYVCTIKKSNIVKNKAKMYFSRSFTMNHILPNIQLPVEIKVHSQNANVAKVKMVMSMLMVKGKPKGGAMITSNWMDVVRQNDMKEVLKMLNKNGVTYKPAEGSESDKGGDEEENDSIHNDNSFRKEFMYKTSSDKIDALISNLTKNSDATLRDDLFAENKYVTPAKHNGVQETGDNVYVTPDNLRNTKGTQDNPFVINDTTKPASSSEVPDDIFARSTTKVNAGQKDDVHDGEDEDMSIDSLQAMCAKAKATGKDNTSKCANSNASRRNTEEEGAGKRK